jgi:hypothetical protein
MTKANKGWKNDSQEHSLAAHGIKTTDKELKASGVINCFKRECNKSIGGCGRIVDKDQAITVQKGKLHLCPLCAGKVIAKLNKIDRGC